MGELPLWVRTLLLYPTIVKCVAGFDVSDRAKLAACGLVVTDREEQGILDVAKLAIELGDAVPSIGLRKLCHFFGYPIRKERRIAMSDWAAQHTGVLTHEQRQYAADDAVFTLMVCGHLLEQLRARTPFRARCLHAWRTVHPRILDCIRVLHVNKSVIDDNWLQRTAVDWDQASVSAASTHDTETRSWDPLYQWNAHQQFQTGGGDWAAASMWEQFQQDWSEPSFEPAFNAWDPNSGAYYNANFECRAGFGPGVYGGGGQAVSAGGCVYYS